MNKYKTQLLIGTSGWMYKHWGEKFYPSDVKDPDKLKYFSERYRTVEINTTFYHFARKATFERWFTQTPDNFVFSVKLNRRYTHVKRLILDQDIKKSLTIFFDSIQPLKHKLGAVLIQLPPSAKANHGRLDEFLQFIKKTSEKFEYVPDFAIEFRHQTWFAQETYEILRKHNVALVIAHAAKFPYEITLTADFTYIRFHGPEGDYWGKYTNEQLEEWKDKIEGFYGNTRKIYVYFNNDLEANAVENSQTIINLLKN